MAVKAWEVYGEVVLNTDKANKSIDSTSSKLDSFGNKAQAVGKKLTTFVTLPILGIGTAMVKLASDAEETNSKFDAVFKDQSATVRDWAKTFSDSVGRSTTANIGFLATIQDTLVPLGFMRDNAAEMSKSVVKLATDLASFNNLPTAEVVRDIQSAIVGNTETLRKYGVVASQEAIIQEAINSGLIKNKNELDATSKAQAIYNLLIKGTVDAQGDAIRTADSTANQFRKLKAQTEDLLIAFGQQLIPVVQDIVAEISKAIKWFSDLEESQKKLILTMAGLAAAVGPAVTAIGTLSRVIGFIAANPIVAAIAAVAALGVAIATIEKSRQEAKFDKLADDMREIAIAAGVAEENIDEFARKYDDVVAAFVKARIDGQFKTLDDLIGSVAQKTGVTKVQAIELLKQHKELGSELRGQLNTLEEQLKIADKLLPLYIDYEGRAAAAAKASAAAAEARAENERRAAEAIREQNRLLREQVLQGRKDAYADYLAALKQVNTEEQLGLTTYLEGLQKRIEIQKDYVNQLIESGLTEENQFNGHIAKIQELEAEYTHLTESVTTYAEGYAAAMEKLNQSTEDHTEEVKKLVDETKVNWEQLGNTAIGTSQAIINGFATALVTGGDAWKALAKTAITSVAGILDALARQELVLALAALANPLDPTEGAHFAAYAAATFGAGLIRALAGTFQDGGVIPGTSYGGDNVLIAANSGERVLTAQQNAAYENFRNGKEAVTYNTTNYYSNDREDINVYIGEDKVFKIVQGGLDRQKIIPGRAYG